MQTLPCTNANPTLTSTTSNIPYVIWVDDMTRVWVWVSNVYGRDLDKSNYSENPTLNHSLMYGYGMGK